MLNQSFWLGTLSLVLFYLWIISFKLSSYFIEGKSCVFFFFICVVFAYLLMTVFFIFYDIFTTSSSKENLSHKEGFFLKFMFVLELLLFIVLPYFYCFYFSELKKPSLDNERHEGNQSNEVND